MDDLNFYKDFYFFEDKRKNDLDGKVNLPILIISFIFSIHFFVLNQKFHEKYLILLAIIAAINLLFILFSIYYLQKSFSNLSNSHWYKELDSVKNLKNYHTDLKEFQKKGSEEFYRDYLIKELTDCASENRSINISRTINLAKCKQFLFISILLTVLFSGVYILHLFKTIDYV